MVSIYICFNMIIQSWRCKQKRGVLWLKSLGLYQQKPYPKFGNLQPKNTPYHLQVVYRAIEQTTRQFRRIQTSSFSLKTCHRSPENEQHQVIENTPGSCGNLQATDIGGFSRWGWVKKTHGTYAIFMWMNHNHTMLFPWYENIPWYLYPL